MDPSSAGGHSDPGASLRSRTSKREVQSKIADGSVPGTLTGIYDPFLGAVKDPDCADDGDEKEEHLGGSQVKNSTASDRWPVGGNPRSPCVIQAGDCREARIEE